MSPDGEGTEKTCSPYSPPRSDAKKAIGSVTTQTLRNDRGMRSQKSGESDSGAARKSVNAFGQVQRGVHKEAIKAQANAKMPEANGNLVDASAKVKSSAAQPSSMRMAREFFERGQYSEEQSSLKEVKEARVYTQVEHRLKVRELSKLLDMPYSTLQSACNVFDKHASHPPGGL